MREKPKSNVLFTLTSFTLLAGAVTLVVFFQNCSSGFAPAENWAQIQESLDPYSQPTPTPFPGPAPRVLQAKIMGDTPYPVFLDENGSITTRDPSVSYRFRMAMRTIKFKSLANILTTGDPTLLCGITQQGQPSCLGTFLNVDLSTSMPVVPEPVRDLVGNTSTLFALADSGQLYYLDLATTPKWTAVFATQKFKKVVAHLPRGKILSNESGYYVLLTTLDVTGKVGFVARTKSNIGANNQLISLAASDLDFVTSLFPDGAQDIAPASTEIAALYPNRLVRYCPSRTKPLVGTETTPCLDLNLPFDVATLWSQNVPGRAGCILSANDYRPYCFGASKTDAGFALTYLGSAGFWSSTAAPVVDEPSLSVDFSSVNTSLVVTIDSNQKAKIVAQESARLGADLFFRLGLSKADYEDFTLNFHDLGYAPRVELLNGRICGPGNGGSRFGCLFPLNLQFAGMPSSMQFTTYFVPTSVMATFYGGRAPLPRSGRFILGNDDAVYSLIADPLPHFIKVISVPGANNLRCYDNICQVDFEDGTSRVDEYREILSTTTAITESSNPMDNHVSSYQVVPQTGDKLPIEPRASGATYGGLTLEQRLNISSSRCGISQGQLVCLEQASTTGAMRFLNFTSSQLVDHRNYFGKTCVISTSMQLSCVVGLDLKPVVLREAAVRFFGSSVYQGVSGRFYGLRERSPGYFGDYELKAMPPADTVVNVVLPRTDMSAWQALSADGEQGVVVEKRDGTTVYRGLETNFAFGGPYSIDVRAFQ